MAMKEVKSLFFSRILIISQVGSHLMTGSRTSLLSAKLMEGIQWMDGHETELVAKNLDGLKGGGLFKKVQHWFFTTMAL